jgi:nucleotide-binding universal stress UspA family protein
MPKRRLAALRNAAARMAALLARHRFVGRFVLVHGSPVHDVLRKARELDADLLVVVKNTRSWWAEALGASVSTGIAARADRDVLVVHGASGRKFGIPA